MLDYSALYQVFVVTSILGLVFEAGKTLFGRRRVTADANILPLILAGVGAGLSALAKHKAGSQQDKAARDQANLNNQTLEQQRLAQQKILAGLEANGWNPFGVNTLNSGGSSNSSTSGVQDSYTKENPFTTPEYQKTDELVRGILENRLSRGSSLPPGYEQNAIRAINAASAGGAAAASNAAARHGLSGQQVFGLNAPIQTARAGQIADLRGNVPLLERQMTNEDMAAQAARQSAFGTGHESRTHATSQSNTHGSQSGFSERGPDIGDLSSLLMPPGTQQSTISPHSGAADVFSTLGDFGTAAGSVLASQPPKAPGSTAGRGSTPSGQCPPDAPGIYPFCY